MKYVFRHFKKIKRAVSGKRIFLMLDYDGTLTPIKSTPAEALIPPQTKSLLDKLSKHPGYKIAIISGRSLRDIKNLVRLKNIIYSGNHGLEIEGPKIIFKNRVSLKYRKTLNEIKRILEEKLLKTKGAFVEDKGLSLSIHYRLVNKKKVALVKTIFHETIIYYLIANKIKIKPGKMVLEIRAPVEWDKGKVALWLLARQRFAGKRQNVIPVYIGDDITDEDAFKVLKNKGITIFVGAPKDSYAEYYVKNTQETAEFLRNVQDIEQN